MRLEILAPLQLEHFDLRAKLPHIFNYQPYFTPRPKIAPSFLVQTLGVGSFLWFAGSLCHEVRQGNLASLVNEGPAEWMDKSHKKRFILWPRIQDWADHNLNFVHKVLKVDTTVPLLLLPSL
ncbi:unnamed protein product [Musa banksii]